MPVFFLLFICMITLLFHREVLKASLFLTSSDYANFLLLGQEFARGNWMAFCFDQNYGGSLLAVLRGGWLWLCSLWSPNTIFSFQPNLLFSYLVTPLLLVLTSTLLARAYTSRKTAAWVALICAFGFPYWTLSYSNDFYIAGFLLGCILLTWRAHLKNPWLELNKKQLLCAGLISGLSLYTWRATLVYVIPYWIPLSFIKEFYSRLSKSKNPIERLLLKTMWIFIFLYLYIQFFGGKLGLWNERTVSLHAAPNLVFVGVLLVIAGLKIFWVQIKRYPIQRLLCVVFGFLIGMMPELIFKIQHPPFFRASGPESLTSFGEFVQTLATTLPVTFKEIILGIINERPEALSQNASLILILIALFQLIRQSKKNSRYQTPVFAGILVVFSFLQIKTYVLAPPRYLFPIFPIFIIALAVLIETVWNKKLLLLAIGTLSIIHIIYQFEYTHHLVNRANASGVEERILKVTEKFKNIGVRVVLSDSYWHSNTYTFLSERKPHFVSTERPWGPTEGFELAKSETRVGILLTDKKQLPPLLKKLDLLGTRWSLQPIGSVNHLMLFVGSKIQNPG